ncbi:MAG: hypothetical protein ACRD96_14610, partial [Bryobacteraceae bacterium]
IRVVAAPQFPAHSPHLEKTLQPPVAAKAAFAEALFRPFNDLDVPRRNVLRVREDFSVSLRMNFVAGSQQPAAIPVRQQHPVFPRIRLTIRDAMQRGMHANSGSQLSRKILLLRTIHNLADCEILLAWSFPMQQGGREEDLVSDLDGASLW